MPCSGSIRRLALGLASPPLSGAVGCGGETGDDVEPSSRRVMVDNALTANALTANALTANALTANALTANALTANALTANALTANGLRDPLSREFLKYVVSCALDDDDSVSVTVDGQTLRFPRLARPGARVGRDARLLRRLVPALGVGLRARPRRRGGRQARDLDPRRQPGAAARRTASCARYTEREATYFGNLFIRGQPRFLCLSPGQTGDERVCGDSLADCPMTVVGIVRRRLRRRRAGIGGFDDCSDAGASGAARSTTKRSPSFCRSSAM